MEKRFLTRIPANSQCRAEIESYNQLSIVKNMSADGLCFETAGQLAKNGTYKITLNFPDNNKIKVFAEVVWSEMSKVLMVGNTPVHIYETGMKFQEINGRNKESIEKFLTIIDRKSSKKLSRFLNFFNKK